MAGKNFKEKPSANYNAEVKKLKNTPPERLYYIHGSEEYLSTHFLDALKTVCLPDGEDDFSYHRMSSELDFDELYQAINAVPFMTERTVVEIRNAELNKIKDPDRFVEVLKDIPDYCTVIFFQSSSYEPDGRAKLVKALKEIGCDLEFTEQSESSLVEWIGRRFGAMGKSIDFDAVMRLMFVSGHCMAKLIPEIEKIAAYTQSSRVTMKDVDMVANHIAEADVFELTDHISKREFGLAASTLAELLNNDENDPIAILALLSYNMRQLYAARLAIDNNMGAKYIMDVFSMRYDSLAKKLISSARGFTLPQLRRAIEICAETDYKMKSSSQNDEELLKEAIVRIAAGEICA